MALPRYTINTTFGEYSAGTEVEILDTGSSPELGKFLTVWPLCNDMEDSFDIPETLVTKRRNRTDDIAIPTREQKRGQNRRDNS